MSCHIPQNPRIRRIQAGTGLTDFPNSLMLVCSSWHHLIIGIPDFWSHIDILLNHPLNQKFFARAKVFAARAGTTPLEIHLCDPNFSTRQDQRGHASWSCPRPTEVTHGFKCHPNAAGDFKFLCSSPMRIKSLDIDLTSEFQPCHASALNYLLGSCMPDMLTRCSIKNGNYSNPVRFLEPMGDPKTSGGVPLSIPSRRFEQILSCTTSLRLDAVCPPWGSKAYHGLTELRLGGGMGSRIPKSSLLHILRSSPGLRLLHFRIDIDDPLPLDDEIIPVTLQELEELDIMGEDPPGHSDKILRWIIPGSKPLQLNFVGVPSAATVLFCARSNVTRFYGEDFVSGCGTVVDMIHRCPRLEILALNARRFEDGNELVATLSSSPPDRSNFSSPSIKVNTLYLLNFTEIPFRTIQAIINKCSVQRLVLRNTSITYEMDEDKSICGDPRKIKAKLSALESCSIVECLTAPCSLDLERWY